MAASPKTIKTYVSLGAAGVLLLLALTVNVSRGCALEESLLASFCGESNAAGSPARLAELRRRIASNPGDAPAYAALSFFSREAERRELLSAASTVAPNDPNVMMARATLALEEDRLDDAATELVQLTERYHHLAQQPTKTLAQMIAQGHSSSLQPHLKPGSHWFPLVVGTMVELKLPLATASTLMSQAVQQGVLPPERVGQFISTLKNEGSWVEAYGLWLARHGGSAPMLFNPSFDDPLEGDGFDWEFMPQRVGREGAIMVTRAAPERGNVLEIFLTGRALPTPIVSQHVLLAPGRYRLAGEYRTTGLRSERGLAWFVRCSVGQSPPPAGKSSDLGDTAGAWRSFAFDIEVSPGCGAVAGLVLETAAPYEAVTGMRGRVYFDAFSLKKVLK